MERVKQSNKEIKSLSMGGFRGNFEDFFNIFFSPVSGAKGANLSNSGLTERLEKFC